MKIAIVGSRSIDAETARRAIMENIPSNISEIISGGAVGVDAAAERVARELHLPMRVIRPDYSTGLGRLAPIERNARIVNAADFVLIIWDGVSRGSQNVISYSMNSGKPMKVVYVSSRQKYRGG